MKIPTELIIRRQQFLDKAKKLNLSRRQLLNHAIQSKVTQYH